MPIPVSELIESPTTLKHAARCVEAMRKAGGDGMDIMLDLHARTHARGGHPVRPHARRTTTCTGTKNRAGTSTWTAWSRWRARCRFPSPPASGWLGRWQFRELFEKRACAIVQPDVSHCGGISEARRIAAMAETYMISVACHNPTGPVGTAASLHVGFATPNYLIQEVVRNDVPWRNDVVDRAHLTWRAASPTPPPRRAWASRSTRRRPPNTRLRPK